MAKKSDNAAVEPAADLNARLAASKEDQAKAERWFARARELGDKRQFDYAVEYYVNGLEYWPDAVEEACKALHGCAVARKQTGGKKPGFKDTLRRSMNDKNAKQAYLNSLWLFGHDPENIGFIEGVVKNASRLRAEDATKWSGGVMLRALDSAPKPTAKQFQSLVQHAEELGDRAAARGEVTFGVEAYQMGLDALRCWTRKLPKDQTPENLLRGLSTKLTILKGKYQDGESFRGSIADTEQQMALHDLDRSVQTEDRVGQLIARAEGEYTQDPDSAGKLKALVDLLRKQENPDLENRAVELLTEVYERKQEYRWKQLADDIRIKQLGRELRRAVKSGDQAAIKERQLEQLKFELAAYIERVEKYPTDLRLRFELAVRYFRGGRFDEAIPLFQSARNDPRNRASAGMYLGRCFFRKGYHSQAISTLREAIQHYEHSDDELAKNMQYWLGRAQEEAKQVEEARKTYGALLQLDYNFRDVRDRLDGLPAEA